MPSPKILGHRSQLAALGQDLARDNVAHAYLFSGARHLGKFSIAHRFARELLTSGLEDEEKARAVDQIDRLLHSDLLVIDQLWIENICEDAAVIAKSSNVPQQHRMKAKAKTDTISIDDIRSLQERLHEVRISPFRCCLIRSAERMQTEAVNALLKILEEPPPGVVFLLTTQALSLLLTTLVSRTRTLHFTRLTDSELEPLLSEIEDPSTPLPPSPLGSTRDYGRAGRAGDERQFLLRVAQGAPGVIVRLRSNPELLRRERQVYSSALAFWHSRSNVERMQLLAPLHERNADADQFLLHLSLALREERDEGGPSAVRHLAELCRNLETNVSRQLLAQNFVLGLTQ